MNIYAKHGSKERLFEMFQNVNKIKLNEEYEDLDNSDLEIPLDPKAEKEANAQMKQHYLKQYSLPMDQYKNPTEKWNKHTLPYDTEFSSDAPIKEESEGSNLRAVKVTFANGNSVTTSMAAHLTDDEIKNYYKIGKQFNLGGGANGVEDNMQPVTNVEILKEQGMNEGKPYVLGKGYTHFAVGKNDNKIYDGWDYKGYDQDELRQFKKDYFFLDLANNFPDMKPQDFKILTRNFLERSGINPTDTNNWYKFEPTYGNAEKTIDNIPSSDGMNTAVDESTDQEKYENVVFMQGDDAFQPLEILDSDGPEAALEYLKQWHYPGEHEGSNELGHGTSDEIFEKDGYIMSWNPRIGYIGLQYDLEHDGGQSVDEGAYSKATRYNKNSIDAVKKRMNRKVNISKKKISEGEIGVGEPENNVDDFFKFVENDPRLNSFAYVYYTSTLDTYLAKKSSNPMVGKFIKNTRYKIMFGQTYKRAVEIKNSDYILQGRKGEYTKVQGYNILEFDKSGKLVLPIVPLETKYEILVLGDNGEIIDKFNKMQELTTKYGQYFMPSFFGEKQPTSSGSEFRALKVDSISKIAAGGATWTNPNFKFKGVVDSNVNESVEFDDKLQGGLGDNAGDQKFSADQIRKGLKVEMEHTDDPLVAMDICIDHLSEDPQYYGDESQDPEQSAQCNAMVDATGNQQDDGVNPDEPSDEVDILLGFRPHNVGDTMDEYDNYNYPPGADADPRAPWHEKDEPDDGKDHSDDEFEEGPEPEGDVYKNRY